jgi:hypothetical protein
LTAEDSIMVNQPLTEIKKPRSIEARLDSEMPAGDRRADVSAGY